MRFRWDWIGPVMAVPYVPTLGPAHPGEPLSDLFAAVVAVAGTGRFLPHDKDRRWSGRKTERVLVDAIEHDRRRTLVPTLLERGGGTVRIHVYGDGLPEAAALARHLADVHGTVRAQVVSFHGPGVVHEHIENGTRVQMKDFTAGPGERPDTLVQEHGQVPAGSGFGEFAAKLAADGFAFLHGQMRDGKVGPVLTVLHDGRVAGAIGPMETMPDAAGAIRLLPQYFGVLPCYRGRGYGRALWRAAMHWGYQRGAAYQLLRTTVGGASDRLCATEGLTSLGVVKQVDA
ncbi:GNAT family N-acetyltransferase [Streptomyces sp. NBC_00704]|uniref:GNAT family N-acetyltransferase n=1 Tax=Streptomyces sp. NBC_00704 TaxID=2975809 RepID=UPI002E347636|nr:GNAT family N-acetyltransferase [Streptomyces sp. NBC_00704]